MKEIQMFSHTVKIGTEAQAITPERKGGITTCDIVTWMCYDGVWFRPLIRSQLKIYEDLQSIKSSHELEAYIEKNKRSMIKPYRLKHTPTGVYYQPHKHGGSNVSLKGKVYLNGMHGLSSAWTYAKRYPNSNNNQLFSIFVDKGSRIHKLLEDMFTWTECKYSYNQLKAETNVYDWQIEELNV